MAPLHPIMSLARLTGPWVSSSPRLPYLNNFVLRILRLFLNVGHDGANGLDYGYDEGAEGRGAGVVTDRRRDGGPYGVSADGGLVAGEVPCGHRHRHDNLRYSTR